MRRVLASLFAGALLLLGIAGGLYWLTTGPGQDLLRAQAERILSDLLAGEVAIEEIEITFERGLGLRGRNVTVYPSPEGWGLEADMARIELREWNLVTGNLALALLDVQGLTLQATIEADGRWSFPPLRALAEEAGDDREAGTPEPVLRALGGLETATRYLLEGDHIADEIVVRGGRIRFEDRSLDADMRPDMGLQRFQLYGIAGHLERSWLTDEAEFELVGQFQGPAGGPVPVSWRGRHASEVHAEVGVEKLDLDAFDGYVQRLSQAADVEGSVTARILLESDTPHTGRVQLEADLHGFVPTLVVDGDPVPLQLPLDRISGIVEFDPAAARILDTEIAGRRVAIGIAGRVERPIRAESLAHLETWVEGADSERVRPIVEQLPPRTVESLREWLGRLESGTVDRLAVGGTTRLERWSALARGELERLPQNFFLSLRVSDVTFQLGNGDEIRRGAFQAEWTADRLELRGGSGEWRGQAIGRLDVTIDGLSRLAAMQDSPVPVRARPTPGVDVLWDLLLGEPGSQDASTPTRFQVEIDYLDHPILRWPLEDAHLVVTPTADGSESQVLAARWGGQPIVAEVLYQVRPTTRLTVGLEAVDEAPQRVELPSPGAVAGKPDGQTLAEWGRGRFELEPYELSPDTEAGLLSTMSGGIRLVGSEVHFEGVDLSLGSQVSASADLTLDLGQRDRMGVDLAAQLVDASCDGVGQLLGLPAGFVTGTVDARVALDGSIAMGQHPLQGLRGTVHAVAEKGEIQKQMPLAIALAAATDGFNPFSKRESLQYDTITAELDLADGILTGRRFEIEGPLRIYATGTLELLAEQHEIDAIVGVFLMQRVRELLDKVPLVSWVIPGSKHGIVGAYFRVEGPVDDPEVTTMAMKSLREELPSVFSMPLDVIEWLWQSGSRPLMSPEPARGPTLPPASDPEPAPAVGPAPAGRADRPSSPAPPDGDPGRETVIR